MLVLAANPAFCVRRPTTTITTHLLNPRNPSYMHRSILSPVKSFSGVVKISNRNANIMFESNGIRVVNGDGFAGPLGDEDFVNELPTVAADGLEVILNNLSKWLVTAVFLAIVLVRHDADSLWAAFGSVLNGMVSRILKKTLNQERPVANLRSDPGMPSSHAQSIFYFVVFSILSVVQWLGLNGLSAAISGLIVAVGSYFTWLRVSQQLHTVSQIIVGALVGTIFSLLWFRLWYSTVLKAFESHLGIRVLVFVGAAGFCVAFAVYVIRFWVMEEVTLHVSRKLQR